MKAEDMPKELLAKIREQFNYNPAVIKLRLHQKDLESRHLYGEALDVGKSIEALFNEALYMYMKTMEESVEKIEVKNLDIPIGEKEKILMYGLVMFMACDLIDFAIMDVDDILHKYDKELHFEMFNDIREVSRMAKEKLQFLQKNSEYMNFVFVDKCDDMYEMMKNKAKAIIRKRKKDEGLGDDLGFK